MNSDRRLLPFLAVFGLAAVKVGQVRGRQLARIAVLIFLLRAGALEWHFVSLRPELEMLAGSISAIPPGARVLPLVDWAGGAPLPERHFWAYGVIARGWVSPCLFHDPGVHSLALRFHNYDPCSQAFTPTSRPDWGRVQSDFDYVWAYRVPQYSSYLSSLGTLAFRGGDLEVFRVKGAP